MKKFARIFSPLFVLLAVVATSCKKEENKVFYEGGTNPVLTATTNSGGTDIIMGFTTQSEQAVEFKWTNPEYQFTTGVSSQDVSYTLEVDTAGANFTNPNKKTVVLSKLLSLKITQSELNDYMLNQLVLAPSIPHTLEIRVKSSLVNNSAVLISNVIRLTATPYTIPPKVAPPAAATLYVTGSATPASWMGGGDPEVVSQKFTRVSETLYELTVNLTGGGSYLLVPRYGNWGAVAPDPEKYGFTGSNNANNVNGDDFKAYGGDILSPAASGTYKIVVDFQRGKFTVTRI
jgi:starch-binding outer membrane protein SusE/F